MSDSYRYRKLVNRHHYNIFRRRLFIVFLVIVLLALVAGGLIYNAHRSNKKLHPTSQAQTIHIGTSQQTIYSQYFKFQDTNKWVLDTQDSTATRFTYFQYKGFQVQYELNVYVNEVPISLHLATSRVLPVRIVNGNSLDITGVSNPCISGYAAGELHKIKEVVISEAKMLCDPDTPQYSVVLSQVSGDYRLKLVRKDGTPIQFVMTFRDLTLSPGPGVLLRIANTFQAR